MSGFSGTVKLGGLDDFISPGLNCVKPIQPKQSGSTGAIHFDTEGDVEMDINAPPEVKAGITLSDCLACSGCITSAETILVQAQSAKEFLSVVEGGGKTVIISISPQSRASIATHFNISCSEVHWKLVTFFKSLGATHVFDTSYSRDLSLLEIREEFVSRFQQNQSIPMIASACPGWVCYAEKTHGSYILPYISTTRSPQQVMGSVVKHHFAKEMGVSPDNIYHVTVMPCYDKKLEASRPDFYSDILSTRDVDCVLATHEVMDIFSEKQIDFPSLTPAPPSNLLTNAGPDGELFGVQGGSGGYLEIIFRYAAERLFQQRVEQIEYKVGRNPDFQEVTLEVNGQTALKFAIAYGFRNIQNLVRKIKQGSSPYHFVEVMACPSGCVNGGGQIKPAASERPRELLAKVKAKYEEQEIASPDENASVVALHKALYGAPMSSEAIRLLHTQYHEVEKSDFTVSTDW